MHHNRSGFERVTALVIFSLLATVSFGSNGEKSLIEVVSRTDGKLVRGTDGRIVGLSLSGKRINDGDVDGMSPLPLKSLLADGTALTVRGLQNIAMPDEIEVLAVAGPAATDDVLEFARRCKKLKVLAIRESTVSDTGLLTLKDFPSLVRLDLDGKFSDKGMEHLLRLSTPEYLRITDSQITGHCLAAANFERLKQLSFIAAPITDEGIQSLRMARELSCLSLAYSKVTDRGVRELRQLPKLDHLILNSNRVTGFALAEFPAIQRLWIDLEPLEPPALSGLATLGRLRDVRIQLNGGGDEIAKQLKLISNLQHLELAGCKITADGLRAFKDSKNLESIEVSYQSISPEIVQVLAELRQVSKISLVSTEFPLRSLSPLVAHGYLQELDLSYCEIGTEDVDALLGMSLVKLKIRGAMLSDRNKDRLESRFRLSAELSKQYRMMP